MIWIFVALFLGVGFCLLGEFPMNTLDIIKFFVPYADKNDKGEVISLNIPWGFFILVIIASLI